MKEQKKYQPKYGLVVICKDEDEQKRLYAKLQKFLKGVQIKVVCV